MVNADELRGIIAKRRMSQAQVARHIGMTEKTFYAKMKKGIFDSDEIEEMIFYLQIGDPMAVFFTNVGTRNVPNRDEVK